VYSMGYRPFDLLASSLPTLLVNRIDVFEYLNNARYLESETSFLPMQDTRR
jgi:hypothetical protein